MPLFLAVNDAKDLRHKLGSLCRPDDSDQLEALHDMIVAFDNEQKDDFFAAMNCLDVGQVRFPLIVKANAAPIVIEPADVPPDNVRPAPPRDSSELIQELEERVAQFASPKASHA